MECEAFSSERFSDMLGIFKLDKSAIQKVAGLPGYGQGVLYIAIASIITSLSQLAGTSAGGAITRIVMNIIGGLIVAFIILAIFHVIATVLGGKGKLNSLVNVYGHAMIVVSVIMLILSFVPVIGAAVSALVGLWMLVVLIVTISTVYGLSTGKSAITVCLPVIILMAILALIGFALVMALFGMGAL